MFSARFFEIAVKNTNVRFRWLLVCHRIGVVMRPMDVATSTALSKCGKFALITDGLCVYLRSWTPLTITRHCYVVLVCWLGLAVACHGSGRGRRHDYELVSPELLEPAAEIRDLLNLTTQAWQKEIEEVSHKKMVMIVRC